MLIITLYHAKKKITDIVHNKTEKKNITTVQTNTDKNEVIKLLVDFPPQRCYQREAQNSEDFIVESSHKRIIREFIKSNFNKVIIFTKN